VGGTAAAREAVHEAITSRLGEHGRQFPRVCGDIADEVMRAWPTRHMTSIAIRGASAAAAKDALDGLAVISARVRETLEAIHGCDRNTMQALSLLVDVVAVEFANLWFASTPEGRQLLREAIRDVAASRRA
jgi:hypothetical protein